MPWLRDQVGSVAGENEITVLVLEPLTHYLRPRYWGHWLKTRSGPKYPPGRSGARIISCNFFRPPRRLWERSISFPLLLRAVRRALRDEDIASYDLIHAHFSSPSGTIARILSRESGKPYVVTEHSSRFDLTFEQGIDVPAVLEDARRIICVSSGIKDSIQSVAGSDTLSLSIVPNPVDMGEFTPSSPSEAHTGPLRLLFVGHLLPRKGVDLLISALKRITDDGTDAELVVIGAGLEMDRLRKQAESLGLAARVQFLGARPHEEMASHYSASDVFVLPSYAESFGVVVVEALASGKPVVATRSGGPEHIIDDTVGMLVDPGDSDGLADAILSVADRLDTFIPENLAEFARSRYSMKSVGAQISTVYNETVAPTGGR